MPGCTRGNHWADLVGIAYAIHLFGVDIAREEVLPAQADRPVIAEISRNTGIDVKPGVVVAVAAAVDSSLSKL
jgi:hypothetical protein